MNGSTLNADETWTYTADGNIYRINTTSGFSINHDSMNRITLARGTKTYANEGPAP